MHGLSSTCSGNPVLTTYPLTLGQLTLSPHRFRQRYITAGAVLLVIAVLCAWATWQLMASG